MPKLISQNELDAVQETVALYPEGITIEKISRVLDIKMSRRTLQRRLALLVKQKRLLVEGSGRTSRYRKLVTLQVDSTHHLHTVDKVEVYVPIGKESELIKQTIRKPIQNRKPVGYNRAFLDEYRPNETFYLSVETRLHLTEIGRSPDGQQYSAGTYVRKIFNRLLIDLSWNSSRLEGNTYSLLETEQLLELSEAAEGKDALETQMILNHKAAIELLVDQADEIEFNRYTILSLHALLSDNLIPDPLACGRLRTIVVAIGKSVYQPLEVPQLIDECFQQILDTAAAITDPFEQAFFIMVHLPYLQSFEDVNKRVSRLAANLPLIRENLSPLSFVDVPKIAYLEGLLGVYELNKIELFRDVFIWVYERSCARYSAVQQSLGKPDPFRLRNRKLIAEIISEIVLGGMNKKTAIAVIKQ